MVNTNWPLLATSVAFDAGVNTTNTPTWSDLTQRMWSLGCDRGRQYELDLNQAGTGQMVLSDRDEFLNPTNPSSPWFPKVLPYRQITVQAMWPPTPFGASVNLINSAAGFDPSFESYTNGQVLPWATPVGGTTVAVSTTTPAAGANCVGTNLLTAGTTVQGLALGPFQTIPGRAYTFSAYVRTGAAFTVGVAVQGGPSGTTATVAGTYTRLAVTFTATQPLHTFLVQSSGTVTANTIKVDNIQMEPVDALNSNSDLETGLQGWTATAGTTLAWSTAWARSGFRSAQIVPDGIAATAGVESAQVPVVAGAQYVAAGWMWSDAGTGSNACGVRVNWFNSSGILISTSSGTDEVALAARTPKLFQNTFTAPAGAAFASVRGALTATPPASMRAHADEVRLLPVTPSPYINTGPVIYGVHRGFIERWPSTWNHQGMFGCAQIDTVDGFAALAAMKLRTEFRNAVLAKEPTSYWPLNEPAGSTTFVDASGNAGAPLTVWSSPYGAPTPIAAGTNLDPGIVGDPGGTGVKFTGDTVSVSTQQGQVISTARPGTAGYFYALGGGGGAPWAASMAVWVNSTTTTYASNSVVLATIKSYSINADSRIQLSLAGSPKMPTATIVNRSRPIIPTSLSVTGSVDVLDGRWHLIVATATQDATSATIRIFVDGVLAGTSTTPTNPSFPLIGTSSTFVEAGGNFSPSGYTGTVDGTLAHLALWNRQLATAEVTDLWNAAQGYPGEQSGTRIARYLSGRYGGASALDVGQSTMGVSGLTGGTSLLDAVQGVALSEDGNLWCNGAGILTFFSRTRRYLATTSTWTFGEQNLPYEGDIAYDFDPQLVYNDVAVTNEGGVVAQAQDATSQLNYGPRSLQRTINVSSDNEATDAANWLLSTHKDPHQRIATLTIKPSANPALWPVALGAEIGDRVTVKRATAAGYTMTADYFIEQISHSQSPDSWTVQFQMSPAFPVQVWILGDATYGQLDVSTVLSY